MANLDNRLTTVLLSMVLGLTVLSIICYAVIYVQPNLPINPLSPKRATVRANRLIASFTATPLPTSTRETPYPPTWTPTHTNTPGPTKTSTNTRTPTPTKTNTPTRTPTSTATSTSPPPTIPPPPTNTATPFPFVVSSHSGRQNCADTGLEGVVTGSDGLPLPGVEIEYGEIGVPGSRFFSSTDGNGRYGALLIPGNSPGAYSTHNWYANVIVRGQQASDKFPFTTDPIFARNPSRCDLNDDDDNNDAGCTPNPCSSNNAIQIKIINWQLQVFN